MRDIRNVCKGLSLPDIEHLSLQETIKRVVNSFSLRTQHNVDVDLPSNVVLIASPIKICAFRFVQEALNNSFKHAPESEIQVKCETFDNDAKLVLTVEDTGPGFEFDSLDSETESLGLGGMRERIRSIGGDLSIESSPDKGTQLKMSVHIDKEGNG